MPRVLSFALCLFLLVGCSRDDEHALYASLSKWFPVERTIFFHSQMRCTAAVYKIEGADPKDALPVQRDPDNAKRAFRMGRVAAIQMADQTPHEMAEVLLLSGDGIFGRQVLASAAQSVPCLKGTMAEGALHLALTRTGALLAYDRESDGLIILDQIAGRLFYVAGDVL